MNEKKIEIFKKTQVRVCVIFSTPLKAGTKTEQNKKKHTHTWISHYYQSINRSIKKKSSNKINSNNEI